MFSDSQCVQKNLYIWHEVSHFCPAAHRLHRYQDSGLTRMNFWICDVVCWPRLHTSVPAAALILQNDGRCFQKSWLLDDPERTHPESTSAVEKALYYQCIYSYDSVKTTCRAEGICGKESVIKKRIHKVKVVQKLIISAKKLYFFFVLNMTLAKSWKQNFPC